MSDPPTTDWLGVASLVSTIFLWLFNGAHSLYAYIFRQQVEVLKREIASKLDHKEVAEVVDTSIEKYHELFSRELKDEAERKHLDNTRRLMRIENLLMHTRRSDEDLP